MDISKEIENKIADMIFKWCVSENTRRMYGFDMPRPKAPPSTFKIPQ